MFQDWGTRQCLLVLVHWIIFTGTVEFGTSSVHLMSSLPGAGNVRFSLNGTTYQNNSIVTLEDIGKKDDALFCVTNGSISRRNWLISRSNWFFPNGTRVPSKNSKEWDFYRTRNQSVVLLNRRGSGEDGIYCCKIPDSMNVTLTIYIGVYSANTTTGE